MKKEYINEIWKPIKGYEGLYEVSNLGRIKSLVNNKGQYREKILKPRYTYGYLKVILCKNGIKKNYRVHRLVAEAFLPNPDNLPLINHKDEQKDNNIVTNLEWCNYSYNNSYGTRTKRAAENNHKKLLQFTLDGNFVKEWQSPVEAEKEGYRRSNISYCCNGRIKQYKGFIWRYK